MTEAVPWEEPWCRMPVGALVELKHRVALFNVYQLNTVSLRIQVVVAQGLLGKDKDEARKAVA